MDTDTTRLRDDILSGRFDDALRVAAAMPLDDLREFLVGLGFETESLAVYGFCVAMVAAEPSARGHGLASDVLATTALNRLPGAYQTAFFHARQAAALAPRDAGYLEFLLFFDGHPERLLSHDEAVRIARDLQAIDSDNAAARAVLAR